MTQKALHYRCFCLVRCFMSSHDFSCLLGLLCYPQVIPIHGQTWGGLIMALTALGIRKLKKPARGRREKWDREIPGLAIRVTENGIRSFNFVYCYGVRTTSSGRVAPHRFRITLGRLGELTLEEAREMARELRKRVRAGG